ncbi:hypothetical protein M3E18_04915 [Kocuria sp. p3-SID1433]|uniref:hypothetical protein n=1 Tax=unclassified Kocuria TaxID=2649579 RepID=UPI0021A3531C|nr:MULTISPECIES: hypothetical protein [unclassified Kocuria]MCT1602899.1 hypothetical protein [Kocuria sp. p3-SID1428]MCT2179888.1 hypothetical protein [Kocuria sp. p3-SID1433]
MTTAARKRLRTIGLGAAFAAAALTSAGCAAVTNDQETASHYSPADGIVEELGDLSINNLLIVAESADSDGRLLGTLVNESDQDMSVEIAVEGAAPITVEVPAADEVRYGEVRLEDDEQLVEPAGAEPGLLVPVTITVDGETLEHELPVLDHTFPRYAEYIPGGAPSTPANPSNTPAPEGEEEGGHH